MQDYPRPLHMLGGYNAMLDCNGSNAWHEFVIALPEAHHLLMVRAELAFAADGKGTDLARFLELVKQEKEGLDALFFIARDWVMARKGAT